MKKTVISSVLSALAVSLCLTMTIISSAYYFGLLYADLGTTTTSTVALSVLTAVSWAALTAFAAITERKFISLFSSVFFGLSFFSYFVIFASNAAAVESSGFFSKLLLVLSLPVQAYMPMFESIFSHAADPVRAASTGSVMLSLVFALANIAVSIAIYVVSRRRSADDER